MAQIHVFGRVMHDLVPKEGQTKQPYVCFDLMERNGGNQPDFYQVWARGDAVARLMKLKVRKGSMIWLTGSQELVDCTSQNGDVKTKRLKVFLDNCGFLPSWQPKPPDVSLPDGQVTAACANSFPPLEVLDGEREALPE